MDLSPHAHDAPLAAESDPRVMGRMQGTPMPPEGWGTVAAIEFVDFPRSRWTVCRIRDLFHTIDVSRRLAPFIPRDDVLPNELAEDPPRD